ncbi:MAG: dienelactone hydrolase family protein [Microscillaceae bacterium]
MKNKRTEKYPEFERHLFVLGEDTLPYRLMRPLQAEAQKSYPLVLFLHGAGERGTENEIPLTHIAPLFTSSEARQKYPCFVLVPQCPKNRRWVEVDWGAERHDFPQEASWSMKLTLALLDSLKKELSVDKHRCYVTGLSMGGYGTWDILARQPDTFAAAAPICGGADEKTAPLIKHIPIWNFHGALDAVVKPSRSRNMIQALQAAGGQVRYTEYPDVQHGSWKPAYAEPEFLHWLFTQKKK